MRTHTHAHVNQEQEQARSELSHTLIPLQWNTSNLCCNKSKKPKRALLACDTKSARGHSLLWLEGVECDKSARHLFGVFSCFVWRCK